VVVDPSVIAEEEEVPDDFRKRRLKRIEEPKA
jgi:hypothetical protein